jgi:hypothetical protein
MSAAWSTENHIQAYSAISNVKWSLDPSIGDFECLGVARDFNVGSPQPGDNKWVVSYMMDNGPVRLPV